MLAQSCKRHCETPAFCVISYGRSWAESESAIPRIDIVFLSTTPTRTRWSFYSRLAQRINNCCRARPPPASLRNGPAPATQWRRRPVATSVDAFRQYQLERMDLGAPGPHRACFLPAPCIDRPAFRSDPHRGAAAETRPGQAVRRVIEMRKKMYGDTHGGRRS